MTIDNNQSKPWYRTTGGLVAIILGLLGLAFLISFSFAVYKNLKNIKAEGLPMTEEQLQRLETLVSEEAPLFGLSDAPLQIVEFSDFQCPFCRQANPIVMEIVNQYGGLVNLRYRHFPIADSHPYAFVSAIASTCAQEQGKFWQYHDLLFAHQEQLSQKDLYYTLARQAGLEQSAFRECFTSEKYGYRVRKDLSDGLDLGVIGTPTFFVNGTILSGVISREQWDTIINAYISVITPQE
ncbi:MAG: DsbA family protein [Candidatus Komeilibacteria bacterium]|nr:DsbA family protein [Candidatus Komeilibacteria bacterium]